MKNFVWMASLLLVLIGCKNESKSESPSVLKGEIKGAKMGKLYVFQSQDSIVKILDSVTFDGNGKFEFGLNFTEPDVVYVGFDKGNTQSADNNLIVFLNPGVTTLETSVEKFYANAKVTGSVNHEKWEEYKKTMSRYGNKNLELIELHFKAVRNKNQTAVDSIENLQNKFLKRKYLHTLNFALLNKDHEIAPFLLLSEIPDANVKFLDSINKSLSTKVKKSKYGKMLNEYIIEIKNSDTLNIQ